MGLLKAGIGALSGVLADQWREYFYCEALPENVLAAKGQKRTSGRSSNTGGSENIISNGSIVAVNEGQCMMIVEQGAIVEFSAEAGEFVWDSSTEPTMFYGGFGEGLKGSWETLKKRFTMGGEPGKDQRVYFFNTKEIIGNKYGTANPVPFRVVDNNIGLDMDIGIKCFGEYSYKLTDPILFYKNVCGNVEVSYTRDKIDSQLKSELLTALQPAFARISEMGIRYSALPGHTTELAGALNDVLSQKWGGLRGVQIVSFGVSSVTANEEDEATIKELQKSAVFRNPNMAAAHLVGAQAEAMKSAAANEGSGAFMAFAGMNMAGNAGGMNAQNLYQMGQQQTPPQKAPQPTATPAGSWTCSCGAVNTGKFCMECAKPKPETAAGWTCAKCGTVNKGKFCMECAAPKPAGVPQYKCDKCGWEPDDTAHPPKFCPECGDPFDDGDIK
ncbi:MAG: SPFH domain-containing protein [Clostridia bacterium]|nr:SPFH domain-containing protein [Clostridia bacterium]